MKKFLATLFVLAALVVTMFPMTTTQASIETVECSWWGKMIHGKYDTPEARRRQQLEQQRRQQEQRRRQQPEQQRRQQQRGY